MRSIIVFFSIAIGMFVMTSAAQEAEDTVYQVSTINALMEGVYDGDVTIGELSKHGDFGIGTFNALDGEMIALDGVIYQAKYDGRIYVADTSEYTPFASVTFFGTDFIGEVNNVTDINSLKAEIKDKFPSENICYAIKITGSFKSIKVRTVAAQKKPYPLLSEAAKEQKVYEYSDINGTIVGFWFPEYMKDINVVGYHFHFVDDNRTVGGHLLGCNIDSALLQIDYTSNFYMNLPETEGFLEADLAGKGMKDLKMVEQGTGASK